MKSTLDEFDASLDTTFASSGPQFRVLILCEDYAARDQAMRHYIHLTEQIGMECTLETFFWDLKQPRALEPFLEAIMTANLIFVAGGDNSELPLEVQSALDVGLSMRRMVGGALVALLGRANAQDRTVSALHSQLEETGRGAGLDFFPGVFPLSVREPACTFESVHDRAERMTPTFARSLHNRVAPVDYGINE